MSEPLAINAEDPIEEQYQQHVPAHLRKLRLKFLDGNSCDRKIKAIKKIPSHITALDLLNETFDANLIELLKTIPAHITSIDLPKFDYYYKRALSQEELSDFLAAIPNHITSLNVGSLLDNTDAIQTLSPLPAKLKFLNLTSDRKYKITSDTFFESMPSGLESIVFNPRSFNTKAIKNIKAPVNFLNMSYAGLDKKSPEECAEIMTSLPASLTRLNLAGNQLAYRSIDDLKLIFKQLPEKLTALGLGDNGYNYHLASNLIEFLKIIPKHVTEIDLRTNRLVELDIAQILHELPLNFQTLNLRYNQLGHQPSHVLINALKQIPDHVTTIDLSSNNLKNNPDDIIKAIPDTVTSLKLDYNYFDDSTDYEQLFKSLPKNLTSLSLRESDLRNCPATSLATAFKSLPKSLRSLDLSDSYLDSLSIDDLIIALDGIPDDREGGLRELILGNNDKDPQPYSPAELNKLRQFLSTKNFFINGIGSDLQPSTINALDERMPLVIRDLVLGYLTQESDIAPGASARSSVPNPQASFLLQVLSHHALTALSAVLMLVGIGAIIGGFVLAGAVSLTLGTGLLAAGFFARHRLASLAEPAWVDPELAGTVPTC